MMGVKPNSGSIPLVAKKLLSRCRPLKEPVTGPQAGKKGVAGKKGAEEVKSAESAVSREEKRDATAVSRWPFLVLTVTFICRERSFPDRFAKISFGSGFLRSPGGIRCIREPGFGRRPVGFPRASMPGFGRTSLGQAHGDSGDD
jgi:hypothetical protein